MKDSYDLYYLANKFNFDGAILTEALQKTFLNHRRQFTVEQFEQIVAFSEDDGMQKKWRAFSKKIDTKTDDFKIVPDTINVFLSDTLTALIRKQKYAKQWSAAEQMWT